MLKMQAFFGDGNQHIGANGYPYLCLHRVLAGAKKHLDAKVLLDPLEEQLHLPTLPVEVGNHVRLQREVVGQKYQAFAFVVFGYNAAQCCGVVRAGLIPRQHTRLIADHRCIDSIHRMRVAPLELGIALGAGHKESLGLVNHEESGKVQIATIHQVERSRLQRQPVHDVDLVGLSIGDVNEAGDIAAQVQQGVQFDGCLGGAKRRPGEHRQAQVDGAGIEGVNRCKPHVIQPMRLRTQVDFDIAQRFAVGQLRKGHGKKLIQTGEVFDLVIPLMRNHSAGKGSQRQVLHALREYELAVVHGGFGRKSAKNQSLAFDVQIETRLK